MYDRVLMSASFQTQSRRFDPETRHWVGRYLRLADHILSEGEQDHETPSDDQSFHLTMQSVRRQAKVIELRPRRK